MKASNKQDYKKVVMDFVANLQEDGSVSKIMFIPGPMDLDCMRPVMALAGAAMLLSMKGSTVYEYSDMAFFYRGGECYCVGFCSESPILLPKEIPVVGSDALLRRVAILLQTCQVVFVFKFFEHRMASLHLTGIRPMLPESQVPNSEIEQFRKSVYHVLTPEFFDKFNRMP